MSELEKPKYKHRCITNTCEFLGGYLLNLEEEQTRVDLYLHTFPLEEDSEGLIVVRYGSTCYSSAETVCRIGDRRPMSAYYEAFEEAKSRVEGTENGKYEYEELM